MTTAATALIAAAGSGERLGAGGPKALVELAGRPLVTWCLDAFAEATGVERAVIAAPPGYEPEVARASGGDRDALLIEVVSGGESRAQSVAAALAHADGEVIVVHDAARPLVTAQLIEALLGRLSDHPGAAGAIAAAPLTDTLKRAREPGPVVERTESRDHLWAAQTPQVFRASALREALAVDPERAAAATDDATLVEQAGGEVLIEPGPPSNLKVTTAADLRLAELILAARG